MVVSNWIFDSKTILKIRYRLSLEYLSIEKVAKVHSRLAKPIEKPKIVPTGRAKLFLEQKALSILHLN